MKLGYSVYIVVKRITYLWNWIKHLISHVNSKQKRKVMSPSSVQLCTYLICLNLVCCPLSTAMFGKKGLKMHSYILQVWELWETCKFHKLHAVYCGKMYWCFPYLRLVQLPSSGGTCMMSLFCRSSVDNLSSSLSCTGSMAPTWLLLIKIVSRVKMRYRTSGKHLNLRTVKKINRIWTKIKLFIFGLWYNTV